VSTERPATREDMDQFWPDKTAEELDESYAQLQELVASGTATFTVVTGELGDDD
jgi:hypothetical protein